ncbi:P-loop containing nucleoside triphosphate hydrolase protein [Trametes polyzona]|nr:P-loop containing nucleoside triphosphate hydrolase protein [Trametes polyzona]
MPARTIYSPHCVLTFSLSPVHLERPALARSCPAACSPDAAAARSSSSQPQSPAARALALTSRSRETPESRSLAFPQWASRRCSASARTHSPSPPRTSSRRSPQFPGCWSTKVVATAKTADLILIMLDATKSEEQRRLLEIELDAVGIRLNKKRPDVVFKRKTTGGITINKTVPLTKTDEKTIRTILASYKLHNCDVMIREDVGTRKYIPCLYVYNKIDAISLEQMDKLAREDHTVVISCELGLNLDYLIDRIWEELDLVKVYTKKRGAHPDLDDPVCLRKGATVEVRTVLAPVFGYRDGRFWSSSAPERLQRHSSVAGDELPIRTGLGKSSKFNPHAQKVGLNHHVLDEDVVSIFTK